MRGVASWSSNFYYNDYEFAFNYLYSFAILPLRPKFYLQYCQLVRSFICNIATASEVLFAILPATSEVLFAILPAPSEVLFAILPAEFRILFAILPAASEVLFAILPAASEVLFAILPAASEVLFAYPLDFSLEMHFHLRSTVKVVFCAKAEDIDKIAIRNRKKAIEKQDHLFGTCSD